MLESELETLFPSYSASIVEMIGKTGTKPNSQQERWVLRPDVKRISDKLSKLKAQKAAVDDALIYMTPREKQIFNLKYMQEKQHQEAYKTLELSKSGYLMAKNKFVYKMAKYLGKA